MSGSKRSNDLVARPMYRSDFARFHCDGDLTSYIERLVAGSDRIASVNFFLAGITPRQAYLRKRKTFK